MLLMDGVKYLKWVPQSEEELERFVSEHASEIFSENSMYFDRKLKLQSLSGIGSIPDGYAIVFGDSLQWHIIEVELSSHPLYNHIVPQISRFISGINNLSTQKMIAGALFHAIIADAVYYARVEKVVQTGEIYKFVADLISKLPILTIIIDRDTEELREALSTLRYPEIKVVEFQTFVREGVGLPVHAHLFEPLFSVLSPLTRPPITPPDKTVKGKKVTFEELVSAGLLRDGQVLYFYNTRPFTDERAQIIVSSDKLNCERDGHTYSKSELASLLLIKHGFKHGDHPVQGPKYWKTEDGILLDALNEQIRIQRGERG